MRAVDMHCDTISKILEERRAGRAYELLENNGHLDLKRMKEQGYLLQNFALFVNQAKCESPWEEFCALYDVYEEEMAKNEKFIGKVLAYEDIEKNEKEGKLSAFLTVEEGAVCEGKVEKLRELYDKGVRMMTLTWNHDNELGHPAGSEGGLTEKGKEFVVEMEQMGMIVDVSHLSDAGFYDVLDMAKKPFVASHSNSRTICNVPRNLTDDMIRKLAGKGGCMGLNFYAPFLRKSACRTEKPGGIAQVVCHAKHIVNCGGMEVLGLGSDFDGIDTNEELPGAQSMEKLWNAFKKAGFRESELDKIWYQNALRVYRAVLIESKSV